MEFFEIGKVNTNLRTMFECQYITFFEAGLLLRISFKNPTLDEVESVSHENAEFKMLIKNGIPILFSKFGNMNWMETPFHVTHEELSAISNIEDGRGYMLNIILHDLNGKVYALRTIGLGNNFSKKLNEMIIQADTITEDEFVNRITKIQSSYTTNELVKMAYISYRAGTIE